jgi:hypothetical protein
VAAHVRDDNATISCFGLIDRITYDEAATIRDQGRNAAGSNRSPAVMATSPLLAERRWAPVPPDVSPAVAELLRVRKRKGSVEQASAERLADYRRGALIGQARRERRCLEAWPGGPGRPGDHLRPHDRIAGLALPPCLAKRSTSPAP